MSKSDNTGLTRPSDDALWRKIFRALWEARIATLSSVLGVLVLSLAPQARDLFLEIKVHSGSTYFFWLGFFVVATACWLVPVYCSSRICLAVRAKEIGIQDGALHGWLRLAFPGILVTLCIGGLVSGIVLAHRTVLRKNAGLQVTTDETPLIYIILAAYSFALAFAVIARARELAANEQKPSATTLALAGNVLSFVSRNPDVDVISRPLALPLVVLFALSIAAVLFYIVPLQLLALAFPRAWVLPLLLGFWVAPLTLLGLLSQKLRFPLVASTLLIFGFAGAVSEKTHALRLIPFRQDAGLNAARQECGPAAKNKSCEREKFGSALERWKQLHACQIVKNWMIVDCPKPIILAAAGGASRAGFFTGSVMGFLQDITDKYDEEFRPFRDQLFAISSVSGSSVGVAYYMALQEASPEQFKTIQTFGRSSDDNWFRSGEQEERPTAGKWKDALQILMAGDFLTPAVAGAAFRDFSPSIAFGASDSAANLELAWERRFEEVTEGTMKDNPLARPLSSFAAGHSQWLPITYFNGSSYATGRRVIASPVDPELPAYPPNIALTFDPYFEFYTDAYDFHDLINSQSERFGARSTDVERRLKRDISLSTAASISARFPIISPHATVIDASSAGRVLDRIVDGAYFENYGALTALDIFEALEVTEIASDGTTGRKEVNGRKPGVPLVDCHIIDLHCLLQMERVSPVIVQISNDPEAQSCTLKSDNTKDDGNTKQVDDIDPEARPPLPYLDGWRVFGAAVGAILNGRMARGTHGAELSSHKGSDHDEGYFAAFDKIDPGYVHFRVCGQRVEFSPGAAGDNWRDKKRREESAESLKDVSMSWWLSKPTQGYLDGQLCSELNLKSFSRLLLALRHEPMPRDEDVSEEIRAEYQDLIKSDWCSL